MVKRKKIRQIITASTPMKSEKKEFASLETECLYGENIEIIREEEDWLHCRLLTDNYLGWIKKNHIGTLKPPTHRVFTTRSFIFETSNVKSRILNYLPMGSKLSVKKINYEWAEIYLSDKYNNKIAYVPTKHIIDIKSKTKNWVTFAEQLLNIPYKWGGRDTHGIDCSALVQLSYQNYGIDIPRNTNDQVLLNYKIVNKLDNLERGCVVFWKGHVGIMTDKIYCIHANAFHMKTVIEPLKDIIKRMSKQNQIIKMMNFN